MEVFFSPPVVIREKELDHGDRLTTTASSDVAVMLMALEALGKGWTSCKIEGDEVFLRKVSKICSGLGIGLRGAAPQMQAIVMDELGKWRRPDNPEAKRDKSTPATPLAPDKVQSEPSTDAKDGDPAPVHGTDPDEREPDI